MGCIKNMMMLAVAMVAGMALGLVGAVDADASVPVLGEEYEAFLDVTPDYTDDPPVRVRIDPELHGSTVTQDLTFEVSVLNLDYRPDEAEPVNRLVTW